MRLLCKLILRVWVWFSAKLTLLAMRLVKLTRKSSFVMHPKHLVNDPHHHWYTEYIYPNDYVLDVGCDTGTHAFEAARHGSFVIGFDYRISSLQIARHLKTKNNVSNIAFISANAEMEFPFLPQSFDKILILDVIEHLYHREELLQEVTRILRPNGLVLLSAPNRNTSWKRTLRAAGLPWMDADHKIEYILAEFIDELSKGGLEVMGSPQPTVFDTPLRGFFDLVGSVSLSVYAFLQRWKILNARKHPDDTTGWRVICRKVNKQETHRCVPYL